MPIYTDKPATRLRNRPLKDYAGETFGRLIAVSLVEREDKWNDHKWLFKCQCGNEKVAGIKQVRSGHTSSCGCLASEVVVKRNTSHGLSKNSATYRSWKDMRARCNSPSNSDFKDYGGRGVSICDRWNDFGAFFADMGERPTGTTLDRIEVNGNYEPSNCRWATASQQANNKRSNHVIEYRGQKRTLLQWCGEFGIDHSKARYRLKMGWALDDVFSAGDFRIAKNTNDRNR